MSQLDEEQALPDGSYQYSEGNGEAKPNHRALHAAKLDDRQDPRTKNKDPRTKNELLDAQQFTMHLWHTIKLLDPARTYEPMERVKKELIDSISYYLAPPRVAERDTNRGQEADNLRIKPIQALNRLIKAAENAQKDYAGALGLEMTGLITAAKKYEEYLTTPQPHVSVVLR